jgi:hypothetical protein
MLETYFSAPKMLGHLRSGPSGPYLDGFAAALERQGYRQPRPCAICELQPMSATSWSSAMGAWATSIWRQSASTCGRVGVRAFKGGRRNHHTIYSASLFCRHLVESGVCLPADTAAAHVEP